MKTDGQGNFWWMVGGGKDGKITGRCAAGPLELGVVSFFFFFF